MFSLAACGGGGTPPASQTTGNSATTPQNEPPISQDPVESTPPSEPAQSTGTPEGQAMASLIGWMMDGTFSYDFTMTSEGPEGTTEGSGSMAMDGGNMAISMEMTVEGQAVQSKVIILDGVTYIVMDAEKMIMKMENAGAEMTAGMMTDYTGITKTGDGTGEIGGKTLPYEEYTESETGSVVRYYLDGGQVYGIESEYEGYKTVMIITNASVSVPAGVFDLPEGYTERSV
jgi:hypothetical protein